MASQAFIDRVEKLNNRVVCGEGGKPIDVDFVGFVNVPSQKKGGKDFVNFELSGLATHVLISANNPDKGAEPLDSPVVVALSKDAFGDDNTVLLSTLNKWLELSDADAIVDGDEVWDRFDDSHPQSIIPKLKTKGFYAKLGSRTADKLEMDEKYGNFPWWANQFIPPVRTTGSKPFADIKKARVAAREAKDAGF